MIKNFIKTENIKKSTKLKEIYTYLSVSTLIATLGAIAGIHLFGTINLLGMLLFLGIELFLIYMIQKETSIENDSNIKKSFYLLLIFSFVSGLSLANILNFTIQNTGYFLILNTFLGSSVIFSILSIFATKTNNDFTNMGGLLFKVLIGLIIFSIINIIWGTSLLTTIISIVGILLFSGFILYDTQNILKNHIHPINATLSLFLDFINLFTSLLMFFNNTED